MNTNSVSTCLLIFGFTVVLIYLDIRTRNENRMELLMRWKDSMG